MGLGFVAAWLLGWIAQPQERHPWPLVPGILIGSIGAAIAGGQPDLIQWIQVAAAGLLLAAGIAALTGREHHAA